MQRAGFDVAFLALALVASLGAAAFFLRMPETPARPEDSRRLRART